MNRTELLNSVTTTVYTNTQRRIKGNTVRDRLVEVINNTLNIEADLNVANGYLGIDADGIVDISFIKSDAPTGKFLKDNGTWATVGTSASTLADILANGNTTNDISIESNSGDSYLALRDTWTRHAFSNGSVEGYVYIDDTEIDIYHDIHIDLQAPSVTKNGQEVATLVSPVFITDITTPKVKGVVELVNDDGEFLFAKTVAGTVLLWTNGQHLRLSATVGGAPSVELDKTTGKLKLIDEGASQVVVTDSNKGLTTEAKGTAHNKNFGTTSGTVLEGNRITQVITNGVTDKAPSEDAVYGALALKQNACLFKTNVNYAHTGTTNETVLYSTGDLHGNFDVNDIFRILLNYNCTSNGNNKIIRIYLGAASQTQGNTFNASGTTQLATMLLTTNAAMKRGLVRNIQFMNSLSSQQVVATTTNGLDNDETGLSSNAALSSMTWNYSTATHLIVTGTLASAGDTINFLHFRGQIIR